MKRAGCIIIISMLVICSMLPMAAFAEPENGNTQGNEQNAAGQNNEQGGYSQNQGSQTGNDGYSQNQDSQTGNDGYRQYNQNGNTQNSQSNTEQSTKRKNENPKGQVSIIFSGDIHSHLEEINGVGGFAKIKTKIDMIKENYPDSFLFDAGDFSMGTAFQTIYIRQAAEMRMMGSLGYDAITMGDHEFDYGLVGTAKMLKKAVASKKTMTTTRTIEDSKTGIRQTVIEEDEYMPELVLSNIDWQATAAQKGEEKNTKKLKKAMKNYGVKDYSVLEKGDVKIAVFGIMGDDAARRAEESGLICKDYIDRAKEITAEIERNKEADIIVCLSHSGYDEETGDNSEDVRLAKEVPGIDVILSAHSNVALKEPITIGDTLIVAAGENSKNIGQLILKKKADGYKLKKYKLYPLAATVKDDVQTLANIQEFKYLIDEQYFNEFGFSYEEHLAKSSFDFPEIDDPDTNGAENTLGDLVADSYMHAVGKAEGKKTDNVDCAIVLEQNIRATLKKGKITTEDAYNVLPRGIGNDDMAGYPLISFYLTGKELKMVPEIDASIYQKTDGVQMYTSGLTYGVNRHRIYLNKAVDIRLDRDGEKEKIKNGELYRVVTGIENYKILETVSDRTRGLISIKPKDKDGNEIEDIQQHIIKKGKREVKEWYALAAYIDSFKKGKVPTKYAQPQGRKVDETSFAPWKLLKQPNNYGLILLAVISIPIVIICGIIIYIKKRRVQRRGFDRRMFSGRSGRSGWRTHRMGIRRGRRKDS